VREHAIKGEGDRELSQLMAIDGERERSRSKEFALKMSI